jgi:alpha-L-rhamnosidase
MVHVVYTWRRELIKHVSIDPSKLELKPIVNGIWPGAKSPQGKISED